MSFPQNDTEYLNYHLTTVRDVELLTNLQFFSNIYEEASVEIRTDQPLAIWSISPPAETPSRSLLNERMGKADPLAADDDTQPL